MIKNNKINILKKKFIDRRGFISDIFYNTKINHIALIKTKKNMIRGNHYHKKTVQYVYIINGKMIYASKKKFGKIKKKILTKGDLMKSEKNEIHAFKILSKYSEMIVFSQGLRGGKDYEKDTYRVNSIL